MKSEGTTIILHKYKDICILNNEKIICKGINRVDVYKYEIN